MSHYCPTGSAHPIPCSAGSFANVTGLPGCHTCPEGFYCLNGIFRGFSQLYLFNHFLLTVTYLRCTSIHIHKGFEKFNMKSHNGERLRL